MIGRDAFSVLAPVLGPYKKKWLCHPLPRFMAVSTIPNMWHRSFANAYAAVVADEIWGFMLEPARIIINNVLLYQGTGTWYLAVSYSHLERNELDGTRAAYC